MRPRITGSTPRKTAPRASRAPLPAGLGSKRGRRPAAGRSANAAAGTDSAAERGRCGCRALPSGVRELPMGCSPWAEAARDEGRQRVAGGGTKQGGSDSVLLCYVVVVGGDWGWGYHKLHPPSPLTTPAARRCAGVCGFRGRIKGSFPSWDARRASSCLAIAIP